MLERRRLGFTSAASLVVASMIGSGVFTSSGFALADLGTRSRVLLVWVLGGLFALCGALSYSALARRFPESGGEYTFLSRTIHPLAGFLAGWVSLLAGFTAPIAAAALGLEEYLIGSGEGERRPWVASGALIVAGLLHGLRLKPGVLAQNAVVGVKVAGIGVFLVIGALALAGREPPPEGPAPPFELAKFAVALVFASFAYSGWNAVVYVASEVRAPERTLPRAILAATLFVTVIYLALNAVFLFAAPIEDLAGRADIGAVAAEALGGAPLRRMVTALVALALFTSVSSMVMAGPRVYARMADDGLFPRLFALGGEVPGKAVALQVALALVLVWSATLRTLLQYVGLTLWLSAAATVVGLMRLRLQEGGTRVRVPLWPIVPAVFVLGALGVAYFLVQGEPKAAVAALATFASGAIVYVLARRTRAERASG